MTTFVKKEHWEKIYQTKSPLEVSWHQEKPLVALEFIAQMALPKTAIIVDIGGGESLFVDAFLDLGYTQIKVLDISRTALEKAKLRLNNNSNEVKFIESDILDWQFDEVYDLWHDRAVFHFLTSDEEKQRYKQQLLGATQDGSFALIGTFSDQGPMKCSGIEVSRYSIEELQNFFAPEFECIFETKQLHTTPFNTQQEFVFCGFVRRD